MGELRRTQRAASATRAIPLRRHSPCALPPPTLPRLGGEGAELRRLTDLSAR